ncbi:MAG: metallophosphoesterase family protein [Candidatus Thermoplasmatota archaeon]
MVVLLVCSDLHGSDEALSMLRRVERDLSPDAVAICGDFTTYGSRDYMGKVLSAFESDLLAVPGNCDTEEMLRMMEGAGASVHSRRVARHGLDFFGFGGGLPSSSNMPFEVEEAEMVAGLRGVAVEGGVMLTHTPPRGMNDSDRNGRHIGSEGIMGVVGEFRPRAVLSGHVHEARGQVTADGTLFVNPGTARGGHYALVEIGEGAVARLH